MNAFPVNGLQQGIRRMKLLDRDGTNVSDFRFSQLMVNIAITPAGPDVTTLPRSE
tara:strand:- start:386 stop:550 length:165 start_codon:yes stop_codon:yes gene_type:complete